MRGVRQRAWLRHRAQRARQLERLLEALRDAGSRPPPAARPGRRCAMPARSRARAPPRLRERRPRSRRRGRGPGHPREEQCRVGHVARDRAGLVERGGERDHPEARHRAVGRAKADDAAERRGLADRAARVGPDRPWGEARRDRGGAAARGAARDAAAIPRVERRPKSRVLGRGAHCELVLVGLAQQRRRRRREPRHDRRRVRAADSPRGSATRPGSGRPPSRRGP